MSIYTDAQEIIHRALEACLPDQAVRRALEGKEFGSGRIFLVALGKAAWQMAHCAAELLGPRLERGVVVTKHGHSQGDIPRCQVFEGGHPVPDEGSFRGTRAAMELVQDLAPQDTLVLLVSGGGSALFESPLIPAEELAQLTSALLACAMARRGYHCGILDADITGPSIPKLFGIHGRAMADDKGCWPIQSRMGIDVMSINLLVENEEDPVVWRGPVIAGAVKQFWTDVVWKDVDFLFVDMPPGTGDVPLTVFQSLPVDGIVVVASPQELVSMIVAKAVNMAEMMKVPMLGIVENMSYIVCPDCGKHINVFGESHVDEVAAKHGLPVLAKCPIDPQLAALSDAGMIETYGGEYLEGAADACEKLLKK